MINILRKNDEYKMKEKQEYYDLCQQISYLYNHGMEDQLEFVLDPHRNALLYIYLKDCGIIEDNRYAIKVKDEYFPRLFDNYRDAFDFARGLQTQNLLPSEEVFLHLSRFELFSVEQL